MRAAKYYNNNDIRLEELPTPLIGKDELLVKVISSGICGSDVMEWYRIKTAPRVLGHEIAGEISAIGENVKNFSTGDRVFVSHHVPCNSCAYCLNGHHTMCDTLRTTNFDPGGFSEYLRVPAINVDRGVFKLPDNMSYDEGTFIEPIACCLRGLRMANIKPGQSVIVIGSGISGLLNIQLARALGAGKIIATDINEYRLKAAKQNGADTVINATENVPSILARENNNSLADLVIVCTGALAAIKQAIQCVDRGGNLLLFAVPEPEMEISIRLFDLWQNGTSLLNTYGAAPLDILESIKLIGSNRVNLEDMITHRLPLEETEKGFKLTARAGESIKVIIQPHKK